MKRIVVTLSVCLLLLSVLLPGVSLAESWVCSYDQNINSSNFCTRCGRSRAEAVADVCPKCGTPYAIGDQFCANCGASLTNTAFSVPVGSIVTFGTYEQTYAGEPIEWIVLRSEGGVLKLMAKYVLECRQMSSSNSTPWKNTKMYRWLQDTFYYNAFTDRERQYILPDAEGTLVNIPSREDLCDPLAGFCTDPDVDDALRAGYGTPHAHKQGLWKGPTSGACNYFTRSEVNPKSPGLIWHLHTGGSFGKTGKDRKNEGIRPLIYVYEDYFQNGN